MAVTNYHTVNGRILGETAAGVRTDYLTDALGSVTATVNASGAVVNRYRYTPYGALLSKTGAGADPKQQWVGSLGYRQTGKKYSDVYVRARHYDTQNGRWTSRDPMQRRSRRFPVYRYADHDPVLVIDPSGLVDIIPASTTSWRIGPSSGLQDCCCGAFRAIWRFRMHPPAKSKNPKNTVAGYIAQHVTVNLSVSACDTHMVIPGESFVCEYVELFPVLNGADNPSDYDNFSFDGRKQRSGILGETGAVKYFSVETVGDIGQQNFHTSRVAQVCGGRWTAGGLFARDGAPPTWFYGKSEDDETVGPPGPFHQARADWSCCPCENWTSDTSASPSWSVGRVPAC